MSVIPFRRRRARFYDLLVIGATAVLAAMSMSDKPVAGTDEATQADTLAATQVRSFGKCFFGVGTNCVIDGDTFWMDGAKIRIADIDAPETHPSRCAEEARLGDAATERLQALLNAGPVELATADRDSDRYGRKLRFVTSAGQSVGQALVAEGLARPWEGRRRPWCDASG